MIDVTPLPHYIAAINATTVGLLAAGYAFIRGGRKPAHRACMIAAVVGGVMFVWTVSAALAGRPRRR